MTTTSNEIPAHAAGDAAVHFLRELDRLDEPNDSELGVTIRRVEADVLEILIRTKRRELGVQHG